MKILELSFDSTTGNKHEFMENEAFHENFLIVTNPLFQNFIMVKIL